MNIRDFEMKLQNNEIRKGAFTALEFQSDVDVRAEYRASHDIKKLTKAVGRLGVNYGHLASIRQAGITPGPLPYGQWVQGRENLIIENKGSYQLRITNTGNSRQRPKTRYFMNGQEVSKEFLQATDYVLPSYWTRSSSATPVYNVKLENVISIRQTKKGAK